MTNELSRTIRASVCFYTSIFLGSLGFFGAASAAVYPPCTTPSPLTGGESITISANCSSLVLNGAGNVQIQSPAIVYGNAGIAINNSGTTNAISNYGIVNAPNLGSGNAFAINNDGTLSALSNGGGAVISGMSSDVGAAGGVANASGTITNISNSGTAVISGKNTNLAVGFAFGVVNQTGTIGNLSNIDSAVIRGETAGSSPAFGIFNLNGTITNLNNSGAALISGKTTGSGNAYGILNQDLVITTLNNSGSATISGTSIGTGDAYGVATANLGSQITTLNNSGSAIISATSSGAGNAHAVNVFSESSISTINNSGSASIFAEATGGVYSAGIDNSGTIGAINNSGSISATALEEAAAILNFGNIANLTNSGSISATSADGIAYGIYNDGSIGALTNSGSISAISTNGTAHGIYNNDGSIGAFTNSGSISAISTGGFAFGITNYGEMNNLTNSGSISANSDTAVAWGVNNGGSIVGALTNSGSISATSTNGAALGIYSNGSIGALTNSGSISATGHGSAYGISNSGPISILTNSGSISATGTAGGAKYGIYNEGTIGNLSNSGVIIANSSGGSAQGVYNSGTISTLTNTGSISFNSSDPEVAGISNQGTITILNNAQGGNGSSPSTTALTLVGSLPTNYNIIINSPTHYGQLLASAPSGTITNFGIYGTPFLTSRTYAGVLSGVSVSNVQSTYDNMSLALVYNTLTGAWDLNFTGASLMGTQQSLVNTANALAPVYAMQNAVLVNSFTYDCTLFDVNNICISVGGRNTQVSAANGLNNTSALLIAAYRLHPNYRIGAYVDQNLSVNNAGSTVNLSNGTPLIGIFGAWAQNHEGTGHEVRVSAAYGKKDTTINRQVVGLSEPGSGSSTLNSQGAQVTAKYGFGIMDKVIVSPYVGVRYTQNNMGGYTENASSTVTAPLTYSALNTNATTALAGVGANYKVIPTVTTFASAGVETDTSTSNGTYSATGINGLTPVNFNPNPVRTRPIATVGAYYDIAKNQRFGVTGIYRQEAYQAVSSTTVMATYTIGM